MTTSTLDLLCMLGDKAVYVLMLMVSIGQPIQQRRLEAITGYAWQTMNKTLSKLVEHRLAARQGTRGPWSLTPYGQQLRLGETLANLMSPSPSDFEGGTLTTTTTTLIEGIKEDKAVVVVNAPRPSNFEGRGPQDGASYPQAEPSYPQAEDNYDALCNVGVGHTVAKELAALPHVNPAYLANIIADWRGDTPKRRTVGMLVHRIREADQPTPRGGDHSDNNRYLSWLE